MIKVFRYINKKQWLFVWISLVFIVIQVWLDLKMPDYMSEITMLVETKGSKMSDILMQGIYMLLCAFGSMISSMIVGFLAAKVAAGLAKTLREKIYNKTLDFSMEEIGRFSTASLINRTTNDVTQIQNLVAMGLQAIIKAPILAVWAVVKISGKSWQWTTATAVAVFVLIIALAITLIFAMPRFKRIQAITDKLNRVTREQLTGIRVVRAYNAERYQENKFAQANDELTTTNLIANRVMAIMSPTMTLISSGLTLAVYWIGTYLIEAAQAMEKYTLFSDMVVFSNYAMQVIMAFMMLNMIFILLPRAQVSAHRITDVLETESSINDGEGAEPSKTEVGTVEFKNVCFRYPDSGADTLTDISFKIKTGQTVAIIGATGSGKTTLINLIPRFYDATKGEILFDGINVKDYKLSDLHDRIGFASQRAVMFSGTVKSNVAFGKTARNQISDEDTHNAVDIAQASEFVENMDGTYNAAIAQSGTNISGGQKQRLSIARAIARKPELLIFDDSFSALDYKTDRALRNAMNEKTVGTTKLIVAQRIGTIRNADMIIVLDEGKIAGTGTHKELLQNCRIYHDIAASQLSNEELGA